MIEKFEPKEIFLTENAISKILSLREEESNKSLMLRVFVTGGGCSGGLGVRQTGTGVQ